MTALDRASFLVVALAFFAASSYPQNCENLRTDKFPIATVGGEPVFLRQTSAAMEGRLAELQQKEFELESKALDDVISKQLLANEAKNKGLTLDELLKTEVDAKVSKPTVEEVRAYSLGLNSDSDSSEDRTAIEESLRKARVKEVRDHYIRQLRLKSQVAILIDPPTTELTCDPSRRLGPSDAPINIIEFSDFSCPYCKAVEQTLKQLMVRYREHLNLYYRDFPLVQIHPNAKSAAEASRCAVDQHKFWEYHDLLFASSKELRLEELVSKARETGIEEQEFVACLMSNEHRAEVERDLDDGMRAGVQTTPAFFINGVYLSGSQPIEIFEKIIDQQLFDLAAKRSSAAK